MRPFGPALAAFVVVALAAPRAEAQDQDLDFFEKNVRPLLAEKCAKCHAIAKPKGGLRIDSRAALLKGGESGPAIVPGKPGESLLVQAVKWTDETLRMPPTGRLPDEAIAAIEEWIRRGAPMPSGAAVAAVGTHWAFEPVRSPAEPGLKDTAWARDPLDAFVLARLEAKGLRPSPEADTRTLIRRASFDLTGLPPTIEEVEAFARDSSPDAFARVVDRLLASPRFGERWGRHWLDVARYADTKGYVFIEERRFPYSYVYRDWVVRALNEDLPYDEFLVEQIAADLLPKGDDRRLAAMGFLTLGRRFLNNPHDIVDDRIDVVMRGTLALTVTCARCHDHKFDPIPQKDYYSLYGVFASSHEPAPPPLLEKKPLETADYVDFLRERAAREKAILDHREKRWKELTSELSTEKSIATYLDAASDPRDAGTVARDRTLSAHMIQRWRSWLEATRKDPDLAALHESLRASGAERVAAVASAARALTGMKVHALEVPLDEIEQVFDRKDAEAILALRNKVAELDVTHPGAPARAPCLEENPSPYDPRVFVRGNCDNPGESVPRQLPAVLQRERVPWKTSGRLELARAIASRENPLTARVFVNRVLLRLLGAPLVRTPSDFGTRSEPPTNPELLDHLAWRFSRDWSVKKLVRAVLLSATWRQASGDRAEARAVDPENALLWRANRKRLDFEAMRDTLLAVSGRLDGTVGGRAGDLASPRRTLYAFVERQNLPAIFRTFDFASPDTTSPGRAQTTVPQQALFFMNSPFVIECARSLAARAKTTDELWTLALARSPSSEERKLAVEFLANAPPPLPSSPWSYGYGEPGEESVHAFSPLPHFTGSSWQGGPALPDPKLGWCKLDAQGGHPGHDQKHAVVRRFTCPTSGIVRITGRLAHPDSHGDGVRARIYSSGHDGKDAGKLGEWIAQHGSRETVVENLEVAKGTTLDFVVDCRANEAYDTFAWAPTVHFADEDAFDAARGFEGPRAPLTAKERLAQVLLETNELVFED